MGKIDIAQCFGNLVNKLVSVVHFRPRIDEYKFRGGPLEITGGGGRGEEFSVD